MLNMQNGIVLPERRVEKCEDERTEGAILAEAVIYPGLNEDYTQARRDYSYLRSLIGCSLYESERCSKVQFP
jgi:hypothetical protein